MSVIVEIEDGGRFRVNATGETGDHMLFDGHNLEELKDFCGDKLELREVRYQPGGIRLLHTRRGVVPVLRKDHVLRYDSGDYDVVPFFRL